MTPPHSKNGAGARAADANVDDLSEVIRSLDKIGQGEFTMRLLLAAKSKEQLHETIPAVHRLFVDARAQVIEESLGNLSAFYTMFPGNEKFNVFPLWLAEDHHARLSSVYAPSIGHPHSEDLDNEYLNVFETRTRTPFFQDAFVNGVKVGMMLGPTGSGKSVHSNQHIAMELKYGGFVYIFDIGGSYESVVELYGGKVDQGRQRRSARQSVRAGADRRQPKVPLQLHEAPAHQWRRRTHAGRRGRASFAAVTSMYQLEPENRRLANLLLPMHLNRYLSKWTGKRRLCGNLRQRAR